MVTKHDVEKFIVARAGAAIPAVGDRLYDEATSQINLAPGAFGFYADVPGSGNPVALDGTAVALLGGANGASNFMIIQRRDTTNDRSPLYERTFEKTKNIHGGCSLGIQIGGEGYSTGSNDGWLIGAPAANANALQVLGSAEYRINATGHGYRTHMVHGVYNHPTVMGMFTSLEWGLSNYTTEDQQRDYTIQALVEDFNQNSVGGGSKIALAIAISTTGGAGDTLAAIIAAGADQTIVIGYNKFCDPINLYLDEARINVLQAYEDFLLATYGVANGTATLVPYVLPDKCVAAPAGAVFAGTTAAADMIGMIAIDEVQGYYDEIPQTKKRIECSSHFAEVSAANAGSFRAARAMEPKGDARKVALWFEAVEDYKAYSSAKKWGANSVSFPNEVDSKAGYDIYTIAHCHNRVASSGMPSTSTLSSSIALVNMPNGAVNPQKAYVETFLAEVAALNNLPAVTL